MRCLVTGGAGFVGRHMCKRLTSMGHNVVVVDNLISESALAPNDWPNHLKCKFDFIKQDAREWFSLNGHAKFDLVVHLAAVVGGRVMIEQAPLAVAEDLAIDAMMFSWTKKAKPGKIICFSSSAAYPIDLQKEKQHYKLAESMIDFSCGSIGVPDMSYGFSKLSAEFLAKLAHETHKMDVVCYRPFSGYGEDQHVAYPFPAILKRAMAKENPMTIWSDTVRDFIYIEDCIDGMIKTMDKISDGSGINLGMGRPTSFSQLAKMMSTCAGYDAQIEIMTDKPAGVFYRVANTTYAKSLGFEATTTLEQGIKLCMDHNRNESKQTT